MQNATCSAYCFAVLGGSKCCIKAQPYFEGCIFINNFGVHHEGRGNLPSAAVEGTS